MNDLRRILLASAVPITKWIGRAHAPYTHKRVTGVHAAAAIMLLAPGDVLMSHTRGELTNLFIPGYWSHGAIYVGDGYVAEAVSEGVVLTDVISFLTSKDDVAVCDPLFATAEQKKMAAAWARSQAKSGVKYDFGFASGNGATYCFELTYEAYQAACGVDSPWELRTETLGIATVVGDDLERAIDKWRFKFDTRRVEVVRVDGIPQLRPRILIACDSCSFARGA